MNFTIFLIRKNSTPAVAELLVCPVVDQEFVAYRFKIRKNP